MYHIRIIPKTLHFREPAGTSRGVYRTRQVWYLWLTEVETGHSGVGECAPLPDLSCDALADYEQVLGKLCRDFEAKGRIDYSLFRSYPSMLFGLETALLHLKAGSLRLYQTPFSEGKAGIPINGLIWMGNFEEMLRRIEEKMQAGFRCIKVKIGAIDFERELELLAHIRRHFSPDEIELRVDANGAFLPEDAPEKLKALSRFHLHSIEQPIRAGQWEAMKRLCESAPFPIALDEELIGINDRNRKIELLDTIRPQYIILKHLGLSDTLLSMMLPWVCGRSCPLWADRTRRALRKLWPGRGRRCAPAGRISPPTRTAGWSCAVWIWGSSPITRTGARPPRTW